MGQHIYQYYIPEQQFRQEIGYRCQEWYAECISDNASAGFVVEVSGGGGGGGGAAKGMLSVVYGAGAIYVLTLMMLQLQHANKYLHYYILSS